MSKYELIIFDMDGTILDTLEDLKGSVNYALKQTGIKERNLDEVRQFVGNGIRKLIERSIKVSIIENDMDTSSLTNQEIESMIATDKDIEAKIDEIHALFTPHYKEHNADKTRPYDGIVDVIKELKKSGYKTAVVSNKPDPAVKSLCEVYFKDCFDIAIGDRPDINKKPAPDAVNIVLNELGVERSGAIYIGDSDVDLLTAKNSELPCIAVTWGFRGREFLIANGATTIIDAPMQILDILV